MKRFAPSILLIPLLFSCDQKAAKAVSCAVADEKLSVAFTDPARARDYLTRLADRLESGEPKAAGEAAELVATIVECLR
jgi:hypothetical protein